MASVVFWCAVVNLAKPSSKPKLVPAGDLYRFKDSNVCVPYRPKSATKFKNEEFGMLAGGNLQKHVILAMSDNQSDLDGVLTRRCAPPTRLSVSPTSIPVSDLSFPEQEKNQRREEKKRKRVGRANTISVNENDNVKLLLTYQKMTEGHQEGLPVVSALNSNEAPDHSETTAALEADKVDVSLSKQKKKKKKTEVDSSSPDHSETTATLEADEVDVSLSKQNKKETEVDSSPQLLSDNVSPVTQDCGYCDSLQRELELTHLELQSLRKELETSARSSTLECAACIHLTSELDYTNKELEEAYSKIKRQHDQLTEYEQVKAAEGSLLDKMKSIVTSSGGNQEEEGKMVTRRSRDSRLSELPSNLIDNELIEEGQVKVGIDLLVSRAELKDLEKDHRYITARVEALVLVLFKNKAYKYSVKSSSSHPITDHHISSIYKILSFMRWSYATSFDHKTIRNRLIKFTSELRTARRQRKEAKKLAAIQEQEENVRKQEKKKKKKERKAEKQLGSHLDKSIRV